VLNISKKSYFKRVRSAYILNALTVADHYYIEEIINVAQRS
jgi:hypothetical protein